MKKYKCAECGQVIFESEGIKQKIIKSYHNICAECIRRI